MESRSCTTTPSTPRRYGVHSNGHPSVGAMTSHRLPGNDSTPTSRRSSDLILLAVDVVKGPSGFGFTLGDTRHGQVIKQIADPSRCRHMSVGDVLVAVNGVRVVGWSHDDTVDMMRRCPFNCVTRLTLVTSRDSRNTSSATQSSPPRRTDVTDSRPPGLPSNGVVSNQHLSGSPRPGGQAQQIPNGHNGEVKGTGLDKGERTECEGRTQPPASEPLRRAYRSVNSASRTGTPCPSITSLTSNDEQSPPGERNAAQRPASRGVRGKLSSLMTRRALPQTPSVESINSTSSWTGSGLLTRSPSMTSVNFSGTPDFIPASMYNGRQQQLDSLVQRQTSSTSASANYAQNTSRASPIYVNRSAVTPGSRLTSPDDNISFHSTASLSSSSSNLPSKLAHVGSDTTSGSGFDYDAISRRSDNGAPLRPAFTGRETCNGYNTRTEVISSTSAVPPAHYRRRSSTANSSRCSSVLGDQTTSGFVNALPAEVEIASSKLDGSQLEDGLTENFQHRLAVPEFTSSLIADDNELTNKRSGPEIVCGRSLAGSTSTDKENIIASANPAISNGVQATSCNGDGDVADVAADEYYDVELHRGSRGFGFSIRGGKEFDDMPLYVLNIADGGAAYMDGRLQNEDHIMAINGVSTFTMTHTEAVELIQNSSSPLILVMKRVNRHKQQLNNSRQQTTASVNRTRHPVLLDTSISSETTCRPHNETNSRLALLRSPPSTHRNNAARYPRLTISTR